jgi:LPPG:FO 2-phospho-L-lactate transferase
MRWTPAPGEPKAAELERVLSFQRHPQVRDVPRGAGSGQDKRRQIDAGAEARFGHDAWFTLGDRDLATHIHRTERLRAGVPLSQVTSEIAAAFGLTLRLLPATDDPMETRIHTADGRDLHFQEYWVREHAAPDVARIEFRGAEDAAPAPGVIDALLEADVIVIAPSNPVVSVGPVLAVPGTRGPKATCVRMYSNAVCASNSLGGRALSPQAPSTLTTDMKGMARRMSSGFWP